MCVCVCVAVDIESTDATTINIEHNMEIQMDSIC